MNMSLVVWFEITKIAVMLYLHCTVFALSTIIWSRIHDTFMLWLTTLLKIDNHIHCKGSYLSASLQWWHWEMLPLVSIESSQELSACVSPVAASPSSQEVSPPWAAWQCSWSIWSSTRRSTTSYLARSLTGWGTTTQKHGGSSSSSQPGPSSPSSVVSWLPIFTTPIAILWPKHSLPGVSKVRSKRSRV